MNTSVLLEEIRTAKNVVADAESDVLRLLKETDVLPRAEKTTISDALHSALLKVRHAREHLGKLETLIRGNDE